MRNKLVDNRYRVIARIGQGAMGKVFQAEHVYTKRPVALKIIHPQFQQDEQYRVRFLREIELACRVQHPNAVQILDAGEAESNMLYMAMEFLNGQTLSNLLKQSPQGLDLKVALHIAHQIGIALDAIHGAGLVHRDLKPDNVMVLSEPGKPQNITIKILDFGIARDINALHSLTGKGMIGTPKFMSPEQTRGEKLTQKSDIYNLGLILYAMLTGKEPFSSDSPVGYVFHHNMTLPAPVSSLRRGVPAHIERAIQKALSKDPALRFETAVAFTSALSTGYGGFKKAARKSRTPRPRGNRAGKPFSSGWKKALVMIIATVAIVYYGMFFLAPSPDPPVYAGMLASFDSTRVQRIDADTIRIVYRESVLPVLVKSGSDSLKIENLQDQDPPEHPPIVSEPSTMRAEQKEEHQEVDLNLLYYTNLRTTSRVGSVRYASDRKSIEENSNILRLREQQRRARQAILQETIRQKSAIGSSRNALPRIDGGVESLRSRLNYPVEAVMDKVSGTVGVRLLIDENGEVEMKEITQSIGFGCDEEVLRVLQGAHFEPARLNNKPVKAWLNLQFSFQLID